MSNLANNNLQLRIPHYADSECKIQAINLRVQNRQYFLVASLCYMQARSLARFHAAYRRGWTSLFSSAVTEWNQRNYEKCRMNFRSNFTHFATSCSTKIHNMIKKFRAIFFIIDSQKMRKMRIKQTGDVSYNIFCWLFMVGYERRYDFFFTLILHCDKNFVLLSIYEIFFALFENIME